MHMRSSTKEQIKTGLLVMLILSSMVLIGIHWRQQMASQWFPFRLLASFFNDDEQAPTDIHAVKWSYLEPEQMMIYEAQNAQWVIPSADAIYQNIWSDVQVNYLPNLVKTKPNKIISSNEWDNLVLPGSTVLSFHVPIPWSLLSWYVGGGASDVEKEPIFQMMALVPAEDINDSVQTVYVLTDIGIRKYLINITGKNLSKRFYKELSARVKLDKLAIPMTKMSALGAFPANSDLLINFLSKSIVNYPVLDAGVPATLEVSVQNIDNIRDQILLNLQDSLVPRIEKYTGNAVFSDVDNQYRFAINGLFSYQSLRQPDRSAGMMTSAYEQVLTFLESRKGLWPESRLVLTGVNLDGALYTFTFHYKVQDLLISLREKEGSLLQAPVIIKANANGVQNCFWQVMSLSEQTRMNYSLFFVDMINELLPIQFPDAMPNKDANRQMETLRFGYVLDLTSGLTELEPSWQIGIDQREYIIPLKVE